MHERPLTVKIKTELGLWGSMSSAPGNFKVIKKGRIPLFLGLGSDPRTALQMYPDCQDIYYLECPDAEKQIKAASAFQMPENFSRIEPHEISSMNLAEFEIVQYLPGIKLFPGFWASVLAGIRLNSLTTHGGDSSSSMILVFGSEKSLLVPEICWELEKAGFTPALADARSTAQDLSAILSRQKPQAVISINMQGMDPLGENYALFEHLNIPVIIWMVDNPFHLLCAIKSRFWTRARIYVTDNWFVNPLRELGASRVDHLPLAAGPGFFRFKPEHHELANKVVFVGRSSFPGSSSFFAATRRYPDLESKAQQLMERGQRPDFSWWFENIPAALWPGNEVRALGLGSHHSGLIWKKKCLEYVSSRHGMVIYGDRGWHDMLPGGIKIKPEVDYYGPLASIYSSAAYVLNLTNMHLPWGLTQRHFDVWAARGFLITDKTRGLEIFPKELYEEISFTKPCQVLGIIARLEKDPGLKHHLQTEFYQQIKTQHTYRQRLEKMLDFLNV